MAELMHSVTREEALQWMIRHVPNISPLATTHSLVLEMHTGFISWGTESAGQVRLNREQAHRLWRDLKAKFESIPVSARKLQMSLQEGRDLAEVEVDFVLMTRRQGSRLRISKVEGNRLHVMGESFTEHRMEDLHLLVFRTNNHEAGMELAQSLRDQLGPSADKYMVLLLPLQDDLEDYEFQAVEETDAHN
ncbi:hypothetical protein D2Q93_02425 [Alicyclobacillaceae bacterium I2511]|nr:hypothetical protein D2Q93_02425 [Alicyclobacillaceae bacterium I2511]